MNGIIGHQHFRVENKQNDGRSLQRLRPSIHSPVASSALFYSRETILLATVEQSVTDVCMEVGFSSLGSFSDLFTRRIGTSPSA
jgi:hypothetical protein